METLNIYTIDDGEERVVIHGVRPLSPLAFVVPMTDPSRQAYVCTHLGLPSAACNAMALT